MKVLIIEDDPDIRENIETLLVEEGYTVETASNGFSGVEKAKEFLPDIIISDILMKGKSGYEVLEELLCDKETKTIPFIFLTAKVDPVDIRKGMELGADDYITKPFKNNELLKAIETRLLKSRIFREASNKNNGENNKKVFKLDEQIYFKNKEEIVFFKVSDINYIEAANQYSRVFLINKSSFLFRKALVTWEETLPSEYFMRIHKKNIIRIQNVTKIEKYFNNNYLVYLKNVEKPFEISKRKVSSLNIIY